ncbi:hypothetical protein ACEQ8H_001237 [Pleosporales sp. CAS-2024a]
MPSTDREDSRDRELVRHSHSFSSIPMWDSSDPERAPPPLPLIPGSPKLTTRPNASALVMQAAKALEEKARESMPASSYTTNPMPQRSPERSLIKGTQHKRMQSLQPGSVRDLRSFLDTHRSPERSPERPKTRNGSPARDLNKDYFSKDAFTKDVLNKDPFVKDPEPSSRNGTPTPAARFEIKDTPATRPSHRAILGENTPPSATMVALQTMTIPPHILDPPLQNVTNSPVRSPPAPVAQSMDSISTQLLSINSIVSSLQKDMSQLSRRSKDNATDLISLKEATNSRDEDIRKSLKDLLHTMAAQKQQQTPAAGPPDASRSSSLNLQDPHMTPTKQFTFPRMPSSNGWVDERVGSPNPYSVEGAASVAMLEKIIREMVTKDGQERLIASLQKLVDKATGETAKKVTELAEFVKQGSTAHAMAASGAPGSASFQPSPGSGALTRTMTDAYPSGKAYTSPKAADFVSDEMLKFLRKIKDSVAESGCVTMSTKTLVQELRGEVLGMGRELARKIEAAEQARSMESTSDSYQDVSAIVQEGLASLKEHMDKVMRDRRRQSMSSVVTRNTVDNNEVYDVVKHALAERGLDQHHQQGVTLDKEAIIGAVREAYDSVELKPNVEIQQFGLERDEILQCLREGLQDYKSSGALKREDVENIVHESLEQVKLPAPINEAQEIREEILMTIRDCLEDLKPTAPTNREFEIELPAEQITEAVKAALEQNRPQVEAQNNAVMQRLESLVDDMHAEFKGYSSASGRDTEQVLDALRDGLDSLRTEIQKSDGSSRDVADTDHIVDHISLELEKLREEIQGYVAEGPRGDQAWTRGDMVSYIKSEFENLHEKLTAQFLPISNNNNNDELLAAINTGFNEMKSQVALRGEDDESSDDINEAIKHEFEQLKEVILGDSASHKNDILESLQAGLASLQALVGEKQTTTVSSDEMIATMKEEFEHLRETLGGSLVRSGAAGNNDDFVDAVRELIDGLRSSQESASRENVTIIEGHLEAFKESLNGALVPAGENEKSSLLETLKAGLEEIKVSSKSGGVNEELLEALRGELEQIRQSDGLTREHSRADTEEVLEAVRLGLDDLRSHLEKRLDSAGHHDSSAGEIIDAMNEGLEGLRADVSKVTDRQVDMTVSYEILDTLKEGLASLREDINLLRSAGSMVEANEQGPPPGNEVVLADDPDQLQATSREIVEEVPTQHVPQQAPYHDFERMELILTQIQGRMDSLDANMYTQGSTPAADTAAPAGLVMKEDLAAIEELLKDVQAAVLLQQDREAAPSLLDGVAKKEDTDAIETLLANTKAKIEEIVLPDPETMVTKENLDDVELVVRTTSEALEALAKKIEDEGATKADITVVQVIADDIKVALDEMRAAKPDDEADPKATKADVDAVSLLVDDVKAKLDEMKLPDPETLPLKFDIEQLTGLIHDFRDSHEKMKETYESDIMKTANNFEDRKTEANAIQEQITDVKNALDDMKVEITAQLVEGNTLETLKESFKAMEETLGSQNVTSDVKDLMETVTREFERAHGSLESLQTDQAEKSALQLEKHDELRDAIITNFTEKLDDKFNVLMAKYDDAQLLADEQARAIKEKADEQEKILESTKAMADELRLTIDTLGASITGMSDRFEDATAKWSNDSTNVSTKIDETLSKFDEQTSKIDETLGKLEEQKLEDKNEHSHTRDEIKNIESVFTSLQDNLTEYHPKFMVALHEIEALVKAHYEHAQKSKEEADERARAWDEETKARDVELQTHFANLPKLLPAPAIEAPEKYDDAPLQEKLDRLLAIEPPPRYDDVAVQEKLDKLLSHADEAAKANGQSERLDEIHAQVKVTAAELSEFVAKQTQLITDGNDSKEREAEELALLVERRTTQKEQLEADLEILRTEKATAKEQLDADIQDLKAEKERVMQELRAEKERVMAELKEEKERTMLELKEEKDTLLAIVATLQVERENLANQKVRLTGEVSSLSTALEIRREELNLMDSKADALERRILNGIMDHSRALMMAKGGSKSPSKLRKRGGADAVTEDGKLMPPPSTAANGLSLALKPRSAIRRNGQPANPAQRRILSLSQISGNSPAPGHQSFPSNHTAINTGSGIKRSHSVKTSSYGTRKGSWGGRPSLAVADKENGTLNEEDEMEAEQLQPIKSRAPSIIQEDQQSETGTERRYSIDSRSYAESYAEGQTPGYDDRSSFGGTGSQYSYASGSSYMTGSDIDRRTSYASTNAHGERGADDHSEDDASEAEGGADDEDDESTARLEFNPSEMSTATADTDVQLPTQSEIGRAVEAVKEMADEYTAPSDSGVGTDLATATFGNESEVDADYFRRAMEEEASTVG